MSNIKYGDIISMKHSQTGFFLHSHGLNYTTGSKQQQVTAFNGKNDDNLFQVNGAHGHDDEDGAVKNGDVIRLTHVPTKRNLHSHANIQSPKTQQQEVTAFGNNGVGDANDDWRVVISSKKLQDGMQIKLVHNKTGQALHSHNIPFEVGPGNVQQEVTAFGGNDANDNWNVVLEKSNSKGPKIKYSTKVTLKHITTGHHLHSHGLNYTTGSKQQQVTAFNGLNNDDIWKINGPHGKNKDKGPVKNGDVIRLTHVATGRNLHSHANIQSPKTQQQEVTAFGNNGVGDENDNWRVVIDSKKLENGMKIKLVHNNTGQALHSHNIPFEVGPGNVQQEVTGFGGNDQQDYWIISKHK